MMTNPDTASDFGGLREQKKQHTRAAIHDAAITLVLEHGLADVTVEAICSDAQVSPRTFFNYYPTKTDAVIGLGAPNIPETVRAAFVEGSGTTALIPDVCQLVAHSVPMKRAQVRELVERRPECGAAIHAWMVDLRGALIATVAERVDERTARLAVSLVLAGAMDLVKTADGDLNRADLATQLLTRVREMAALTVQ